MDDQAPSTMTPPAPGAQDARHGVLPVGASLMSAPHDGLLLLAALTGHRSLLTVWLRVEGHRAGGCGRWPPGVGSGAVCLAESSQGESTPPRRRGGAPGASRSALVCNDTYRLLPADPTRGRTRRCPDGAGFPRPTGGRHGRRRPRPALTGAPAGRCLGSPRKAPAAMAAQIDAGLEVVIRWTSQCATEPRYSR